MRHMYSFSMSATNRRRPSQGRVGKNSLRACKVCARIKNFLDQVKNYFKAPPKKVEYDILVSKYALKDRHVPGKDVVRRWQTLKKGTCTYFMPLLL